MPRCIILERCVWWWWFVIKVIKHTTISSPSPKWERERDTHTHTTWFSNYQDSKNIWTSDEMVTSQDTTVFTGNYATNILSVYFMFRVWVNGFACPPPFLFPSSSSVWIIGIPQDTFTEYWMDSTRTHTIDGLSRSSSYTTFYVCKPPPLKSNSCFYVSMRSCDSFYTFVVGILLLSSSSSSPPPPSPPPWWWLLCTCLPLLPFLQGNNSVLLFSSSH